MGDGVGENPVTYATVGATRAADLLTFPPEGYRPMVRRARIGHGDDRFAFACTQTLSWGIQRRSGLKVRVIEGAVAAAGPAYTPVGFDADGTPVAPDTAWLLLPLGLRAPVRVIYVIDEPQRRGFAYGTLPGHPESGEEAFVVDQTADGSVWLTVTSISRPSAWYWWAVYPALRVAQWVITRRYLRALSGPMP
jgi:uncharacterized protein (UPF0548 family)